MSSVLRSALESTREVDPLVRERSVPSEPQAARLPRSSQTLLSDPIPEARPPLPQPSPARNYEDGSEVSSTRSERHTATLSYSPARTSTRRARDFSSSPAQLAGMSSAPPASGWTPACRPVAAANPSSQIDEPCPQPSAVLTVEKGRHSELTCLLPPHLARKTRDHADPSTAAAPSRNPQRVVQVDAVSPRRQA
jgi:hypothetical protein